MNLQSLRTRCTQEFYNVYRIAGYIEFGRNIICRSAGYRTMKIEVTKSGLSISLTLIKESQQVKESRRRK